MSFRKINYKLRPAKTVERKMIAESFRKLSAFHPLQEYQYIGFGSIYFVDYSLFHKTLGLTKLISIEKEEAARARVEFNKPFSCIKLYFDESSNVLPTLSYEIPSIIWLDYDGRLTSDCLGDINTVCASCTPGSVLLVTVNVQQEFMPMTEEEDENTQETENPPQRMKLSEFRLEKLQEQVSRSKVPASVTGRELNNNGLPKVIREILHNEVTGALDDRNGILPAEEKLHFKQLYNIRYNDGANMLTFGGVFLNESQKEKFNQERFYDLPFCKADTEDYQIKIPNLTNKEVVLLDSRLHDGFDFEQLKVKRNQKDLKIIPESEIRSYAQVYRFYPTFTESIW